jgi:hypothetical protein
LVSIQNNEYGYDILSFDEDGNEIHIEVKTTSLSALTDNGFWLSEYERETAAKDNRWCIYRVWSIDTLPKYENLGNIVLQEHKSWILQVASWYVKHN